MWSFTAPQASWIIDKLLAFGGDGKKWIDGQVVIRTEEEFEEHGGAFRHCAIMFVPICPRQRSLHSQTWHNAYKPTVSTGDVVIGGSSDGRWAELSVCWWFGSHWAVRSVGYIYQKPELVVIYLVRQPDWDWSAVLAHQLPRCQKDAILPQKTTRVSQAPFLQVGLRIGWLAFDYPNPEITSHSYLDNLGNFVI